MPEEHTEEDIAKREFNLRIVADKKPYFMRYIYPDLMQQYTTYVKNGNTKSFAEFRMSIDELRSIPCDELTEEQREFLRNYDKYMPVGVNNCVMNRICRRIEGLFDGIMRRSSNVTFDYSFMRSGVQYTKDRFYKIEAIYKQHHKAAMDFMRAARSVRMDNDESVCYSQSMLRNFRDMCGQICSNRFELCDIVLDVCYRKVGTRQFVWDMVGESIVENLLRQHDGVVSIPVRDPEGDIYFKGIRFSMTEVSIYDHGMELSDPYALDDSEDTYEADSIERGAVG